MSIPPVTTWDDETLLEDLLSSGVVDWLDVLWIEGVALRVSHGRGEVSRLVWLGLVAEALFRGLIVAGRIKAGTFSAWSTSPAQSFEVVARGWLAADQSELLPGDIAWFAVTPAGEEIGRAVLERERAGTAAEGPTPSLAVQRSVVDVCLAVNLPFVRIDEATLLVPTGRLGSVMPELDDRGYRLLRIEGFVFDGSTAMPVPSLVAVAGNERPTWRPALTTVSSWPPDVWANLVLTWTGGG